MVTVTPLETTLGARITEIKIPEMTNDEWTVVDRKSVV